MINVHKPLVSVIGRHNGFDEGASKHLLMRVFPNCTYLSMVQSLRGIDWSTRNLSLLLITREHLVRAKWFKNY